MVKGKIHTGKTHTGKINMEINIFSIFFHL